MLLLFPYVIFFLFIDYWTIHIIRSSICGFFLIWLRVRTTLLKMGHTSKSMHTCTFFFFFFFPLQLIKNPKPIWTETSSNWNKISISITIDGNSYLFLSYSVKNSPFTGISSVLKATYCLQPHKYLLYGNIVHILGPTVIMMTQDKILVLWTSQLIIRKIRVKYIEVGILPVLRRTTLSVSLRLFQDQWRSA